MSLESLIAEGRAKRNSGDSDGALKCYRSAADQAQEAGRLDVLLHAQRHVADLARETSDVELALDAGAETVHLARTLADIPQLDLANALRVYALALEANGQDGRVVWREARLVYQEAGVIDGVAECDEHLA